MYTPKLNLMTNQHEAICFMQRYSFATIVTVDNGVPSATHLPFVVSLREDKIILTSHFAKANPQAKEILNGKPLVIFTEPNAYISTKHYDREQNVPTWNYMAVHAYGCAVLIDNPEAKAQLLAQTIQFYEADYLKQWNSFPEDYKLNMMKGITGFEIVVDELQGKSKLSQNRSVTEKQSIITQLKDSQLSAEKDIAEYMEKLK
ncbi:FMN-binding negative transcriptional regulator [Mucilaginibacter antarcticus]|uniref:FMN-binding negative transcriptional regulator n=1 Tax=Mucilaginibacter antarcticus TaxID=1855725 RepID=A0ABW5XUK3_9SPHI